MQFKDAKQWEVEESVGLDTSFDNSFDTSS
jgi:hypothetical protein